MALPPFCVLVLQLGGVVTRLQLGSVVEWGVVHREGGVEGIFKEGFLILMMKLKNWIVSCFLSSPLLVPQGQEHQVFTCVVLDVVHGVVSLTGSVGL